MDDLLAVAAAHCPHIKLASWKDLLSQSHCYQCMGCGVEVAIPPETICVSGREGEAGIVGLTFGETWRAKILHESEYERRWHHDHWQKGG